MTSANTAIQKVNIGVRTVEETLQAMSLDERVFGEKNTADKVERKNEKFVWMDSFRDAGLPKGTDIDGETALALARQNLEVLKVTTFSEMAFSGLKDIPTLKRLVLRAPNDHERVTGVPREDQNAYVYLQNIMDLAVEGQKLESLDIGRNHRLGTKLGGKKEVEKFENGGSVTRSIESGCVMITCISYMRNLTELSLHEFDCWGCQFTARSISALAPLEKLRSFSLYEMTRCPTVEGGSPAVIQQAIKQWPQLETLRFELPTIQDDREMAAVYEKIAALPNLANLLLQDPTLHPEFLAMLANAKKLQSLSLTHVAVQDGKISGKLLTVVQELVSKGLKECVLFYEGQAQEEVLSHQVQQLKGSKNIRLLKQLSVPDHTYDAPPEADPCVIS